jgi:signal transduction histidine kinase
VISPAPEAMAVQEKLDFLGTIAHELRTPLNAIMGYVELITEEIHGPVTPGQRVDLERIRHNQEHLVALVNELLTYVRGKAWTNPIIAVRAHDAVARAVGLIGNTLANRSLSYEHDSSDPDLVMCGDAERIRQILVNLLANAVKFTQRGGHITTRCAARGDQVHISVIDNGIGLAPDRLDSIFEPFVELSPPDPADEGVGLGLAISRDLARTMRGDLVVQSTLGQGSCFTLCLPRDLHSTPPE